VAVSEDAVEEAELRVGGALARDWSSRLLATHVVQLPRQTSLKAGAGLTAESGDLVAKLERFAKTANITVRSLVAVGHSISHVINEVAQREQVEVLVLGWRGHVYEKRIRGSVADAVLRGSPTQVLLVRDRVLPEKVKHLTLAVSPGIQSELTVSIALSLARGFDAKLRVITLDNGKIADDELSEWFAGIRQTLEDGIGPDRLDAEILAADHLVRTLVEEADRADLFVMGTSRDWVDKDHLLGMIPDRVANQSRTTVVVAKHEESRFRSMLLRIVQLFHSSG